MVLEVRGKEPLLDNRQSLKVTEQDASLIHAIGV